MKTPRESFQVSGKSDAWKKVVSSVPEFETACDYALLQLRSEMSPNILPGGPTDVMLGFDANAQMTGAARVLEILRTIHEPIKPPITPKRDTLNYGN